MLRLMIDDAIVEAEQLFSPLGRTIIVPGRTIAQRAHEADALIIRSRTKITDALLTNNPQLRFIGSSVVGLDHIDQSACKHHGVHLYTAQGCNARSVAEYVINHIVRYAVEQDKPFSQLRLAIIGVGHVGKQLAALAHALGISLMLNDPPRAAQEKHFQHTPLDQCLQQADILSLHTPLTNEGSHPTLGLIQAHNLALLKSGSLFINAARGDIVDELALLQRPDLHIITDCWSHEPHINEALLAQSECATPHIAGHAWDAKLRGGWMVANALSQWLGQNSAIPFPNHHSTHKTLTTQQNTAIAQLNDILKQAYDFQADDKILRQSTEKTRAEQFENYRRDYPMRREWNNLVVENKGLATQSQQWLGALGFKLINNG